MALEDAWLFLKVDADFSFDLKDEEGDHGVGGYAPRNKNIIINPAGVYQKVKEWLERTGVDREPKFREIMSGMKSILEHEGAHAADHQLHGQEFLDRNSFDTEMVAHLLQNPENPRMRMEFMRRHPAYDEYPESSKEYIDNYLDQTQSDMHGMDLSRNRNYELQYGAPWSYDASWQQRPKIRPPEEAEIS